MEQNQNQPEQPKDESDSLESLESQTTVVAEGTPASGSQPDTATTPQDNQKDKKKKKRPAIKGIAGRFNIYLLLFILVIVIAAVVSFVGYQRSKEAVKKENEGLSTQPLSEQDLEKLRQTDVKVGDPKQILSVESNAIFAGKVLIRDSLEVAGQIKVGGPLNLPGISVSGTSNFDQVSINNLQISGSATVQGQLNVQNNLGVSGNVTIGGTLSAARLNIGSVAINSDLLLSRHIDAGGGTPGKTDGGALGAGGTSSVSGTDTAGTVNINTGGGTVAGCFVTVSFTNRFNEVPHVVVTPVGSAAGSLNYYINRSATNFSICTNNPAPVGQNIAFDYIVID
jgi:hypothetical protein